MAVGIGDDQPSVVGRHGEAIREREAVGDLPHCAVGRHQRKDARCHRCAGWKVEAEIADVGVTAPVDNQVAPGMDRQAGKVGIAQQRPIRFPPAASLAADRVEQQAAVGQEGHSHQAAWHPGDDLAGAIEIHNDQFTGAHVGDPEASVVPARRLTHQQAGAEDVRCGQRACGRSCWFMLCSLCACRMLGAQRVGRCDRAGCDVRGATRSKHLAAVCCLGLHVAHHTQAWHGATGTCAPRATDRQRSGDRVSASWLVRHCTD